MTAIRIDAFAGLNLKKDPKKGPFWQAVRALNADVREGSIDVVYPVDTSSFANLGQVIFGSTSPYRIYHLTNSRWLHWESYNVEVVPAPVTNNTKKRIVFVGDGPPQVTDSEQAGTGVGAPARAFILGMPIPAAIVKIASSGGSGVQNRTYVYTLVSPWGEESAPCTPIAVVSAESGATVEIDGLGCVAREYTSAPYGPIGAVLSTITNVAGTPNVLRLTLNNSKNYRDYRPGDRVLVLFYAGSPSSDRRYVSLVVGQVNYATGEIDCPANIWGTAGLNPRIFRVLPINRYNVIGATADTPAAGQVTLKVDTTEGLRAGERVTFENVGGMTSLNGQTITVDSVGTDAENPSFVVTHAALGAYTNGGEALRKEPHNTGDVRITNITWAAGVATATVESTAGMSAGKNVLIQGVMGAKEANRLVTVASVPSNTTFTFPLASMTAYVSGGLATLEQGYPYTENTITGVSVAGGAAPFTVTATLQKAHTFAVGDMALAYDIVGSVEINNVTLTVSAVTSTTVSFSTATSITAYVSGGKLVKVFCQMRKRIYRTNAGNSGAEFQLVAELPGETCRYTDTKDGDALGEVMESDGFIQPPVTMKAIGAHQNGFLAGLDGDNAVIFCEPYKAHAWPAKYKRVLSTPAKGLGVAGSMVVVTTNTLPVTYAGSLPEAMDVNQVETGERATSQRTASTGLGVIYRGTTGMYAVSIQGGKNITQDYLPGPDFSNDAEIVSAWWGNKLYWFIRGESSGYVFDPTRGERALVEFSSGIYDLHVSPLDGQLYASYQIVPDPMLPDAAYYRASTIFKRQASPAPWKFEWKSQVIRTPKPVSFGVVVVEWDWTTQSATMKAREESIAARSRIRSFSSLNDDEINLYDLNGDALGVIYSPDTALAVPSETYLKVTVWADVDTDDEAIIFDDFVVNNQPVRIPGPRKSDAWRVQAMGNARVTSISLAETIRELRAL